MSICKGMKLTVLTGNDKGKTGEVCEILESGSIKMALSDGNVRTLKPPQLSVGGKEPLPTTPATTKRDQSVSSHASAFMPTVKPADSKQAQRAHVTQDDKISRALDFSKESVKSVSRLQSATPNETQGAGCGRMPMAATACVLVAVVLSQCL